MQVPIDHQEHYKGYLVRLRCTESRGRWAVDTVGIWPAAGTAPALFPQRPLPGHSDSANQATQRGMAWAMAVVDQLDPQRPWVEPV